MSGFSSARCCRLPLVGQDGAEAAWGFTGADYGVAPMVVFLTYAPVAGRVTLKLTVEAGQTWRTTADLNLALS
eukprot:symbB.v1.2.023978.t1/scaffold2236.1/size84961/12